MHSDQQLSAIRMMGKHNAEQKPCFKHCSLGIVGFESAVKNVPCSERDATTHQITKDGTRKCMTWLHQFRKLRHQTSRICVASKKFSCGCSFGFTWYVRAQPTERGRCRHARGPPAEVPAPARTSARCTRHSWEWARGAGLIGGLGSQVG